MSESAPLPVEVAEVPSPVAHRAPRWQLGLQRLILLIAAIAVWMTVYLNHKQNVLLDSRIKVMVPLAHELIVDDPSKIAVEQLEPHWMDDHRWDLYLPAGSYRLCLATRKVPTNGLAPVVKSVPIRSGTHQLTLVSERKPESGRVTVIEGKTTLLDVLETAEWNPGIGSEGGAEFTLNEQLSPDKPVVLYRRRFMKDDGNPNTSNIPPGPTEGVMLWIERAGGARPGR